MNCTCMVCERHVVQWDDVLNVCAAWRFYHMRCMIWVDCRNVRAPRVAPSVFYGWMNADMCGNWRVTRLSGPTCVLLGGCIWKYKAYLLQLKSWNYEDNKKSITWEISKIFQKFLRICVQKWVAYNFIFLHSVTSPWPWLQYLSKNPNEDHF